MDMNEAVSKAIGAERVIAKLTVRELAASSGIPERSLVRVLQNEREIKVNQVAQIAGALGIYPHELIETAENLLEREGRAPVPRIGPRVAEAQTEGFTAARTRAETGSPGTPREPRGTGQA